MKEYILHFRDSDNQDKEIEELEDSALRFGLKFNRSHVGEYTKVEVTGEKLDAFVDKIYRQSILKMNQVQDFFSREGLTVEF